MPVTATIAWAGFMVFDGMRAVIVGDYLRPGSGEHAGQLGPWADVVETLGIDPLSPVMRALFVALGVAGVAIAAGYALEPTRDRWRLLVGVNISALWYLVAGTLVALAAVVVLMLPAVRPPVRVSRS